jgi:hypothetical protein
MQNLSNSRRARDREKSQDSSFSIAMFPTSPVVLYPARSKKSL